MENQVNVQEQSVQKNVQKGGANNTKLIVIISSIAAALLIVIVAVVMMFPSSKSVANKYLSGYKARNVNKVLSTLHPDVKKEEKDDIKDMFQEMKEEKFVVKSTKLDSNYEKISKNDDEFESYTKLLEKEYDIKESSVKEIRIYDADVKYSYDGETDEETLHITVAKIGIKWYVIG